MSCPTLDARPKGDIRQVWLLSCGGCGATREVAVQTRKYALQRLIDAGCQESVREGLLRPKCAGGQP
jgi:hypothetical protein